MDSSNAPSQEQPAGRSAEAEDLVARLPSSAIAALRAAATPVATEDLAQLVEDLDPRHRSGEGVRERTVTRRASAGVDEDCGDPGEVDVAPTDPMGGQRVPGLVSETRVNDPEEPGSIEGGQR